MSRNSVAVALDVSAITLSGLCLVHCLMLPMIIAVLPMVSFLSESEWVHKLFVGAAVPISGYLIVSGNCSSGRLTFLTLAISGLALLCAAAFLEPLEAFETPVTVIGALLLAGAHVWRWKRHRH